MTRQGTRRVLVSSILVGLSIILLIALADLTQNRPDPVQRGSTRVQWAVSTKTGDPAVAAAALWAVCQQTINGDARATPVAADRTGFQVDITPQLGPHAQKRLRGCLQDATIDKVSGHDVVYDHDPGG